MTRSLSVGLLQPLVALGDPDENLRRIEPLVAECARRGARVVLGSESGLNGLDHGGLGIKSAFSRDDRILVALEAMVRRHGVCAVFGFIEKDGSSIYNSAVVFTANGRVFQRKHRVTEDVEIPFGVSIGPAERTFFEIDGYTCAVLICADWGIPGIEPLLASRGCNLILSPVGGLGHSRYAIRAASLDDAAVFADYVEKQKTVCLPHQAMRQCRDHGMAIAACNQSGFDEKKLFFQCGHSMLVDRTGALRALVPGEWCADFLESRCAVGTIGG